MGQCVESEKLWSIIVFTNPLLLRFKNLCRKRGKSIEVLEDIMENSLLQTQQDRYTYELTKTV